MAKRIVLAGAGAGVLLACIGGYVWAPAVSGELGRLGQAIRALGPMGFVAFALLQALIALVGILPASLLGIAAGAIYGVWPGFALSGAGVLAGAAGAFWLSRSFARPLIQSWLSGRLSRFDRAVSTEGWRLVCLLRVSPILPFSLTSYALGLSGIGFGNYCAGTLASLPALLGYVAMGAMGARFAPGNGLLHDALLAAGIVATALLAGQVSRLLAHAASAPVQTTAGL